MEALYSSFSASLSSVTKVTQILPQVILWQFCFRYSVYVGYNGKKLSYEIIKIIGSLAKIWLHHLPVTCFAGFWTSFLVLKLAMKKRNKRVAKCVFTIFLFFFLIWRGSIINLHISHEFIQRLRMFPKSGMVALIWCRNCGTSVYKYGRNRSKSLKNRLHFTHQSISLRIFFKLSQIISFTVALWTR